MATVSASPKGLRKLNCNPQKSHFCVGKLGRGSCIPNSKACRYDLKGVESTIAAGTVAGTVAGEPKPVAPAPEPKPKTPKPKTPKPKTIDGYTKEEQAQLKTPHQRNLYGIQMGEADTRTDEERWYGETMLRKNVQEYELTDKVDRIQAANPEVTDTEAEALASWINHNYKPINSSIYDPEPSAERAYGETAGIGIIRAIKKIPKYDRKVLEAQAKEKKGKLREDKKLTRGVSIAPNDLDGFLAPYEAAVGKDSFKEPTVLATTGLTHIWTSSKNVQYVVTPKDQGQGQGILVDQYKHQMFEGEVLYPPYAQFKVRSVKRSGNRATIYMDEL